MPGDSLLPALATTAAAIGALMFLAWAWSIRRRDTGVVELVWPVGLVAAAAIGLFLGEASGPRKLLVPALVGLWGARLFLFLVWRNLVAELHPGADLNEREDRRRRVQRRKAGQHFWWQSLFSVFGARGAALFLVALPVVVFQTIPGRTDLNWHDYLGVVLVLLGLGLETVADGQLFNFKMNPGSHGQVLTSGLWRYSRHPNYFGEFLVGWGLWTVALGSGQVMLATIVAPITLTLLLLRFNGIAALEAEQARTRPAYSRYAARTSAFLLLPNREPEEAKKLARAH